MKIQKEALQMLKVHIKKITTFQVDKTEVDNLENLAVINIIMQLKHSPK